MEVKWNNNGNWLLTASRDHLLKLFDIRNMKEEMQMFKGHKKEATSMIFFCKLNTKPDNYHFSLIRQDCLPSKNSPG